MKTKKTVLWVLLILGAAILGIGIILGIIYGDGKYIGFATGVGCAWVALGFVGLARIKWKPELVKQEEVNSKDERVIRIREKSGDLAFFISIFVNVAATVIFFIMDNLIACFIVIASMLLQWVIYFIALYMNNKRM